MTTLKTPISRVTRSKVEARDSYNSMSRWYDLLAGLGERKHRERGLQMLAAKTGETALEIGFGTGHGIVALARSVGQSGQVYGIDISDGMLDVTRARVAESRLSTTVNLKRGDAMELPYESGVFDALFASFTLELFDTPEIPIVLQQCRRVLRRGGRICVVAMAKREANSAVVRIYEWAHEKFPRTVDCRPIFAQKALEDAGFQVIGVVEESMLGLPVDVILAGNGPSSASVRLRGQCID
jgi:ubiquinone/menaquinone biosynthesis C-methylase UbiE